MDIVSFFLFIIVMALTPGTNIIICLGNAMRFGFKRSLPYDFGVLTGCMLLAPVCAFFASALFAALPEFQFYMKIAGAVYMLYLALGIWKSSGLAKADVKETGFFSGVFIQLINPQLYMYVFSTMSVYVLPHYTSWQALVFFSTVLAVVAFLGTVVWSFFGAAMSRVYAAHARGVNTVLALLLVYCAVSLFL